MVDLMPWPDSNISREPVAGKHGLDTLEYVLLSLIPELQNRYGPLLVILGGYSLGGLLRFGHRHKRTVSKPLQRV